MASEYDYNWELSASETNINVGLLKQSEVKKYSIILKNDSFCGDIQINKIKSSCSCLHTKLSKNKLHSRETSVLSFDVAAGFLSKNLYEEILIEYSNLLKNNIHILKVSIEGKVKNFAYIVPRRIEATGNFDVLQDQIPKIRIYSDDYKPICNKIQISCPENIFQFTISSDNNVYEVKCKINNNVTYGVHKGTVSINFLSSDNSIVYTDSMPYYIERKSPITALPASIYLNPIYLGETTPIQLEFKSTSTKFDLNSMSIIYCNKDIISITDVSSTNNRRKYILKISPTSDGIINEKIIFSFSSEAAGTISIPIIALVESSKEKL